ncbi:MAG TPA: DUF1476 domain-containing protein [Hyphomicrobiales bacterium]|nr:DUF1476 domain-containing protein [Hyphomicrobiales bacterium]
MTTFDEREKAFEQKFFHDEELRFRATARRNKLFGIWAAEKMGLSGSEAEDYAKTVVKADLQEAGDEDVLRKVDGDLKAKGANVSDTELRTKLVDMMVEAVKQIEAERK